MSGILSGPIDLDGPRRKRPSWPKVQAKKGLRVQHRSSGYQGHILRFLDTHVIIVEDSGTEQTVPVDAGAFLVNNQIVSLARPSAAAPKTRYTASGSIAEKNTKARKAVGSRILVEGLHDAELVEKIWGDDLRSEGVVVLPLHGADDLAEIVDEFDPSQDRKLGILLDHLIDNTKETRIAQTVRNPHVLICGHPYVDIWEAILPEKVGLQKWPQIPKGTDWKTGIKKHLGYTGETGALWKHLLNQVDSFYDLESSLIGAVEQLIDFVAPPPFD